jgi:hypothetical protein
MLFITEEEEEEERERGREITLILFSIFFSVPHYIFQSRRETFVELPCDQSIDNQNNKYQNLALGIFFASTFYLIERKQRKIKPVAVRDFKR